MKTKSFILLLALVLVFGATLGGAFIGGIAVGSNQKEDAPTPAPAASSSAQPQQGQLAQQALQNLQERVRSGQITQEQADQIRQQFQGRLGQAQGQGPVARAGLAGTIEKIEGNTLTVNTPQGPLQATIGQDTSIQKLAEITLADLLVGMAVTVVGQRGEGGAAEADSVIVLPEGASIPFGPGQGAFLQGGQPQR
jgi:hypothetical protein